MKNWICAEVSFSLERQIKENCQAEYIDHRYQMIQSEWYTAEILHYIKREEIDVTSPVGKKAVSFLDIDR